MTLIEDGESRGFDFLRPDSDALEVSLTMNVHRNFQKRSDPAWEGWRTRCTGNNLRGRGMVSNHELQQNTYRVHSDHTVDDVRNESARRFQNDCLLTWLVSNISLTILCIQNLGINDVSVEVKH